MGSSAAKTSYGVLREAFKYALSIVKGRGEYNTFAGSCVLRAQKFRAIVSGRASRLRIWSGGGGYDELWVVEPSETMQHLHMFCQTTLLTT